MSSRVRHAIFGVSALVGCSNWTRFDDIQEDTPVAALKKPDSIKSGFGVALAATSADGESSRVLVGGGRGKSRAAVFDLGSGDDPQVDARDTGSCSQRDHECYFADRPAGLGMARAGSGEPLDHCYALGIGREVGGDEWGIVARCADQTEYVLPVPDSAKETEGIVDETEFQEQAQPFVLAADKDPAAALIAGGSDQGISWFYPPLDDRPIELDPPADQERGDDYGAAVAVARMSEGDRLLAVGAPAENRVWLFRWEEGTRLAEPVGCLGGPTSFGRTLAAGRVDDDDLDDLVVADETNISVFSGSALELLEPADFIDCSIAALPPGGLQASFQCGSRGSITGCPGGFGDSIDVGDLDGDDDGEVIVGVPEVATREESRAGAVLVYDVEGDNPEDLTDVVFWTSLESGDRLGASVVAARTGRRDVIVAGAPGSGRTAVFYCLEMIPERERGDRCR